MSRVDGSSRSPSYAPVRNAPNPDPGSSSKSPQPTQSTQPPPGTGYSGESSFEPGATSGLGEAPGSTPPKTELNVKPLHQGKSNGCGTASLATVMSYFGNTRTREQIDEQIRPYDMPTAPDRLMDYARGNGMRAEIKTDGSVDDLARMVDQGVPPIVLIDPDGNGNDVTLHYVTVSGYSRDASGKISELSIANTATGKVEKMSVDDFQKRWGDLKLDGHSTHLNNVMLTTVPKDGEITGLDGVTRKASDIELPSTPWTEDVDGKFVRLASDWGATMAEGTDRLVGGIKKGWNYLFG